MHQAPFMVQNHPHLPRPTCSQYPQFSPPMHNEFQKADQHHFQTPLPSPTDMLTHCRPAMAHNSNDTPIFGHLPTPYPSAPNSATSISFHASGLPSPGFPFYHPFPEDLKSPTHPVHRTRRRRASVCSMGSGQSKVAKPLEKKYICPYQNCGKSFDRPFNLRQHCRTHNGERPFACERCEKSFSRAHDLKRHIMAVHENYKPFQCYQCDHRFTRHDALARHVRQNADCEVYYNTHNIDPSDQEPSPAPVRAMPRQKELLSPRTPYEMTDQFKLFNPIPLPHYGSPFPNTLSLSPVSDSTNVSEAHDGSGGYKNLTINTAANTNINAEVSPRTKELVDAFLRINAPSPSVDKLFSDMDVFTNPPKLQVPETPVIHKSCTVNGLEDSWDAIEKMVKQANEKGVTQDLIWDQMVALPTPAPAAVLGKDTLERLMKEHDMQLASNTQLTPVVPIISTRLDTEQYPPQRRSSLDSQMHNIHSIEQFLNSSPSLIESIPEHLA